MAKLFSSSLKKRKAKKIKFIAEEAPADPGPEISAKDIFRGARLKRKR